MVTVASGLLLRLAQAGRQRCDAKILASARKLRLLDGTFNALSRVFEQTSSWESCLQCLADASNAGPSMAARSCLHLMSRILRSLDKESSAGLQLSQSLPQVLPHFSEQAGSGHTQKPPCHVSELDQAFVD